MAKAAAFRAALPRFIFAAGGFRAWRAGQVASRTGMRPPSNWSSSGVHAALWSNHFRREKGCRVLAATGDRRDSPPLRRGAARAPRERVAAQVGLRLSGDEWQRDPATTGGVDAPATGGVGAG